MANTTSKRPWTLIVPVLTAFLSDGSVDWSRIDPEIAYILEVIRPTMVAVAAVEVQEYQYLTDAEREALIRGVAGRLGGRVPYMVGISHPNWRRARALAELAREVGADAVQLLLPLRPSGGKPAPSEVTAYVEAVAAESSLPLWVYHNPGPGTEMAPEDLARVCRIPKVAGVKESSRNLRHIGWTKTLLEEHTRYCVTMEMLLAGMELGVAGGTLPPPAALVGRKILEAHDRGDWEAARDLQAVFRDFPARWMRYGLIGVMKAAMAAVGVPLGDPYPPFSRISDEDREAIGAFVRDRASVFNPDPGSLRG